MVLGVPLVNQFTLERFGGTAGRILAVEASAAADDRLGLTHTNMVRGRRGISKARFSAAPRSGGRIKVNRIKVNRIKLNRIKLNRIKANSV